MEKFSKEIIKDQLLSLHKITFALINTGKIDLNGEHWMGVVMNKQAKSSGYFDLFGKTFKLLENTLNFDHIHKTRHVVQSESVSTCGLHTVHVIIRMMDPMNKSSYVKKFNVLYQIKINRFLTKCLNIAVFDRKIVKFLINLSHNFRYDLVFSTHYIFVTNGDI